MYRGNVSRNEHARSIANIMHFHGLMLELRRIVSPARRLEHLEAIRSWLSYSRHTRSAAKAQGWYLP